MFFALTILITVALTLGVKIASTDGMVLSSFRKWAEIKNEKNITRDEENSVVSSVPSVYDVIILCHWCMPSLWSFAGYFFSYILLDDFKIKYLILYPVIVCATSLLNGIIWGIHNKLNS